MFRVVFFVENRKLGDSLEALKGLAHSMEPPQPMVNAEKDGKGKLKPSTRSGGLVDLAAKEMRNRVGATITSDDMKKLAVKHGGAEQSYWYITRGLLDMGLIKRTETGVYQVLAKAKGE